MIGLASRGLQEPAMTFCRKLFLLVGLLAVGLAGCATVSVPTPDGFPDDLFVDAALPAPAVTPPAPQALLALSPAMQHYLDVEIAAQIRRQGPQRGLVEALRSKGQLRLEYDAAVTRTAAEAFDARTGNCLSLALMSAALAKHLRLPVRYQALVGYQTWSRSGSLTFVSGHVSLVVGRSLLDRALVTDSTASDLRMDFGAIAPGRGARMREVSEATIVAMFLNNRAAESLLAGDAASANAHARAAARAEPHYAASYNTLGVVYRRQGIDGAAERAFVHALTLADDDSAALSNLAVLLEAQGRATEAVPLRARLARLQAEPPFQHFDLAREALARGDYAQARDHLLRELKRDPEYHEFHYWLALALAGLGDTQGAARHLSRAVDNSVTRQERALYAGKLDRLKGQTRTN
jgi:Flp pilus assembly protein TadD